MASTAFPLVLSKAIFTVVSFDHSPSFETRLRFPNAASVQGYMNSLNVEITIVFYNALIVPPRLSDS
jgi:hypothetical protein